MMASQSGLNDINSGVHTMFAAATIVTQDNTGDILQQLEQSLSTPESILMVISLSLITLLTIIGNTMVIIAIFNYKPLKNVQNMFLVNLAIADISVAIFVMPFSIVDMLYTRWVFGTFLCELWLTSDVLLCTASILTLCTIALDRYWAIYDPINYAQRRTIKQVLFKIACVWIISSLISIPPLFGLNDWPEEFAGDTPCKYSEHIGYVIYSASGSFYLPLLIMSVVYYKIYRATSKRLRGRVKAPSSQPMWQGHGPQPPITGGCGGSDISRLECKPANCVSSYDNPLPSTATTTINTKTPTTTATKSTNMTITTDSFREHSSNDNDSIVSTPSVILTPGQQSQKFTLSSPSNVTTQHHHSQYDSNLKKNAQLSATNIANIGSEEIDHHHHEYESNYHRASISSSCNNSNNNNNHNNRNNRNNSNNNNNSNHHRRSFSSSPIVSETIDRKVGQNDGHRPRESVVQRFWEEKQKISLSKERRAARILGAVMGVFTICWLPFFIMYLIIPFYPNISWQVRAFITWLGYVNSALNPIIYTIFNVDFRRAFQRQLCCQES